MATSWGSILAGGVALALAEPILVAMGGTGTGASNLAKLAQVPAVFVSRFMDPTIAAFPGKAPQLASDTPAATTTTSSPATTPTTSSSSSPTTSSSSSSAPQTGPQMASTFPTPTNQGATT